MGVVWLKVHVGVFQRKEPPLCEFSGFVPIEPLQKDNLGSFELATVSVTVLSKLVYKIGPVRPTIMEYMHGHPDHF